ncbi:MAG: peptide ABC transporter substrate-binding protein [Candidatus Eremiobacteraeota bacterium]|nr:peptide ABC transporter substrate-binding protein [Candidatus Eremiobacteraeota bacterium]
MKRLVALVVAASCIAGCSKAGTDNTSATGEHSWTRSGVLRIAIQSEPKNLNILLASNTTDNMIDRFIFDTLTTADATGTIIPALAETVPTAENGGISKDGLTVTFHLRKGVKWSDGVALTSKDVKFSWQSMVNPNNNVVSAHGFDEVKSVDTPDDTTVVLHLKEKFAPIVSEFFGESDSPVAIVPAHLLAQYQDVNRIPYNNEPIGSGPFKLSEWVKGDHITLVPNASYYRGAPGLKQIVIHIIPDENTSLNELRTHDIDWMFEPSFATYASLRNMPDVLVHYNAINGYEGVQLNTSHPPLDDKNVRLAITLAIDKKRLLDSLTFSQQKLATEDLPDFLWAYNKNVTVNGYDPAKSKQLLAAAGFTPGANGILTKGGTPLSLLLVSNGSNATRKKAAVLMQQMLHQVGIDVSVKFYDGATLFAPAGNGGILQGGKFDMGLSGWFAGVDPDNASNYVSKNIPPGGYNYTRYKSAAMDAAQSLALQNYDRPTRKKAYATIEELLATDNPQIFFWWDRQAQGVSPDFKGFDPNPVTESWNAYTWTI